MTETSKEVLAGVQKRLVYLQDSIKTGTEPLDHNVRQGQEITAMQNLLTLIYELLPAEIVLQIKATVDLLEQGVPTGE